MSNGTPQYFTVEITNNSSIIADADLSVLAFGVPPNSPPDTDSSWIQFDSSGNGTMVTAALGDLASTYSLPLSSFPQNQAGTAYVLNLPEFSGRVYLSSAVLCLLVNPASTGAITIDDPTPFDPADPNYFTLYDKLEITFIASGSQAGVNIDTTAVDFFCLPFSLQLGSSAVQGLNMSRSDVLSMLQAGMPDAPWSDLVLTYGDGADAPVLRVMSPYDAQGVSAQPNNFPSTYLDPYVTAVWSYYTTAGLDIECNNGTYSGQVNTSNEFVFTSSATSTTVTVPYPDTPPPPPAPPPTASNNVFGCNVTATVDGSDTEAGSVIPVVLATALNVGILPLTPPQTGNASLPSAQWNTPPAPYYTANSNLDVPGGPWWNVYAAAVHRQGNLVYAFPYDDQAGQSDLLTGPVGTTAYVTLEDCTGAPLVGLTGGAAYTINFSVGYGGSGSVTNNDGVTTALAYGGPPTQVTDLSSGFTLSYGTTTNAPDYTVYIVPSAQLTPAVALSSCPELPGLEVTSVDGSTLDVSLPGE